ncbi:uncharacterized protein LOC132200627 [Neocloeon triangulifer]|uniref:uncharacterized protein LOC132200627 n=1 Tax=Neocloeon triangulifer TaxID=2078957 RepID=UPI00286F8D3D|nr:uncharacterized protein LOC132200627 [Neocloeon triangulifer]XP_059482228.1 uncharacterized protein LOC132200627 [Neocloeon triangulifer]
MLLTCKCLNVSIAIEGAEIGAADLALLGITDVERQDPFFKCSIGTVELGEINKEQATLVYIRHTGEWLVHQCLNCETHTHAIHKERRGNCVIVNAELLSDPQQIDSLRNNDAFSPVFRIVVNRDGDLVSPEPSTTIPKVTALHPIGPLQAGLMALQQKLNEAMRQQTALVEEKIRLFSEQQYAELEIFRKTAHEDQLVLAKILKACPALQKEEEALAATKPPQKPQKAAGSVKLENSMLSSFKPAALSKGNLQNKPRKSIPSMVPAGMGDAKFGVLPGMRSSRVGVQNSLDTEGLFDLEGMDEPSQEPLHSEDETDDTDESGSHDEGIHIPRQRIHTVAAGNLARSLPVTVPIYQQHIAGQNNYDDEENPRDLPQDPQDIAASIKALAKSVHGEHNVFGDLPRPRFSTQL